MLEHRWFTVNAGTVYLRFLETNQYGTWVEMISAASGGASSIKLYKWEEIALWTFYPVKDNELPWEDETK